MSCLTQEECLLGRAPTTTCNHHVAQPQHGVLEGLTTYHNAFNKHNHLQLNASGCILSMACEKSSAGCWTRTQQAGYKASFRGLEFIQDTARKALKAPNK